MTEPFEFGFADAIQQMWAAFMDELAGGNANGFGCVTPKEAAAANFGFDVTPARLVTGLITERGVCGADAASIAAMYPDKVLHTTK